MFLVKTTIKIMKIVQYRKAEGSGQRDTGWLRIEGHRPTQDRGMQASSPAQERRIQATGSEQRDTAWLRTEGRRPTQDRGAQPGSGQKPRDHHHG